MHGTALRWLSAQRAVCVLLLPVLLLLLNTARHAEGADWTPCPSFALVHGSQSSVMSYSRHVSIKQHAWPAAPVLGRLGAPILLNVTATDTDTATDTAGCHNHIPTHAHHHASRLSAAGQAFAWQRPPRHSRDHKPRPRRLPAIEAGAAAAGAAAATPWPAEEKAWWVTLNGQYSWCCMCRK